MAQERFPALVVRNDTDPPAVAVEQLCVDDLSEGDVVVAVEWSAVNYKDGLVTVPHNKVARRSPLVPGVDLAGRVVASTDPALAPGTAVLAHGHGVGVSHDGGFAPYARLPAGWVLALPDGLSARDAMVIGTAGFTAALSVDDLEARGLTPADGPVLVTGATGGVGSQAVALLAARGYEVVASSGKTDRYDWLRALGAGEVVGRDALDDAPRRVLGSERWAAAVDCVGGATLAQVLRTLRYGAAVAASGLTAGAALETTVYPFITRAVSLIGVDSVRTPAERRARIWQRLGADLRPPDLDTLVEDEIGLDQIPDTLARILRGEIWGRVLVRPQR